MDENAIAVEIVDAAYKVHTSLGPGLYESVYESVFEYELKKRGLEVKRQLPFELVYEGICLGDAFRADILVNDKVLVELKSVEKVLPVHKKQVLTYLRLSQKRLGFLINFNSYPIKEGITRIANGMPE